MRNKSFSFILTIVLLGFSGLAVQKAEAQFGDLLGNLFGGLTGGTQNVRIIGDASESSLTTAIKTTLAAITGQETSDAIQQLLFKEQVLDPAAWGMAKEMQQQLTGELLKWLGGQQPGQDGEVPFIQDYGEYYQNEVVDKVVGEYIFTDRAGDGSGQCDPEKSHKVLTALNNAYQSERQKNQQGGALQCGNEETNDNYENAFHRLFADFLECRDEACQKFAGQKEMNDRMFSELWLEEQVVSNARGFKPQRVCTDVTTTNGVIKNDCKLVNPPSLAADMTSFNLVEMPGLQLLNMDEFNEIASNLMNNLANQALQGLTGILGLTGNPTYSSNVFGEGSNLSYVDALLRDSVNSYQTNMSNPITNSLALEKQYYALQSYILDEIKKLENKLDSNQNQFSACFDLDLTDELKKIKEDSTTEAAIASTTVSILTILDQQYTKAVASASDRNSVLSTYNNYKSEGFFHTSYQIQELEITFIDLEFAQLVDKFKYDTAVERQRCGGDFDYDGILNE